MAIKKWFTPIIVLVFSFNSVLGQNIHPLKIGDTVPDIHFGKVLNYKFKQVNISDFKGKLVLLDFWFTGCLTCIQQFPHFEELQKKFGDRILILPVGFDSYQPGSIELFVNKRRGSKREMKLPTAIQKKSDSLLLKLFPTHEFPHDIWISPEGVLIGITGYEAITENNILNVLQKRSINFKPYINKRNLNAYSKESFLIPKTARNINQYYGSLVTGYIDSIAGVTSRFGLQTDSSVIRLFEANLTLFGLYRLAYKHEDWEKRMIVENNNNQFYKDETEAVEKFDNWQLEEFKRRNLFSYELILPNTFSLNEAYEYMHNDLDRFFKIKSRIENRKVKCFALTRTSSQNKLKFLSNSNSESDNSEFSEDLLDASIRNGTINGSLMNHLNNLIPNDIVIDETNYSGKIDMEMHLRKNYNLKDIRANLKKYDLDLVEVEREMPMLVLTNLDKPKSL